MASNTHFVTGEHYALSELFSGKNSIIIPDLQRDYCWGNDNNRQNAGAKGDLATDFVSGLIEQYGQGPTEKLNMGLIYGYEVPAGHVQLCDGQQRLTTLFLLIGMLNKKAGKFRRYLISDYEFEHADRKPHLCYAIRETTLYFLSDLVCNFFTSPADKVVSINHASWYFTDYDFDPSIRSMLSALGHIEQILSAHRCDEAWALGFGHWLVNNVTFMYFDMETRRNGEETFVVINTSGEPLSASQNLKPLVLGAEVNGDTPDADKMWEEMETWFWKKRKELNDTADAGFSEFLRWVYMTEQYTRPLPEKEQTKETKYQIQLILKSKGKMTFPYAEIGINTIYRYWKSLKWLYSGQSGTELPNKWLSPAASENTGDLNVIAQNDCFVLLPLLRFVYLNLDKLISEDAMAKLNLKRLFEFVNNIMRLDNAAKAVNTLVGDAIKIVDLVGGGDLVAVLDCEDQVSDRILTKEELHKLRLLKGSPQRSIIEQLFWKAQKSKLWNGRIMPLIRFATGPDELFSIDAFRLYEHLLDDVLFCSKMKHGRRAALLRRCMIMAADRFEPVRRGSYHSFAWEWDDWYKLFSREQTRSYLLEFFNFIFDSEAYKKGEIETALEDYISLLAEKKKDCDYSEFAIDGYLLSFTQGSEACDMIYDKDDWQLCTSGGTGRHTNFFARKNAYILRRLGGTHRNSSPSEAVGLAGYGNWKVWYWAADRNSSCVVVQRADIKLDVRYRADKGQAEFVLKRVGSQCDLGRIVEGLDGLFELKQGSDSEGRHSIKMPNTDFSPALIEAEVRKIIDKIEKLRHCPVC